MLRVGRSSLLFVSVTFASFVVKSFADGRYSLVILLREYATQDEHPQQDAYRVPTLTWLERLFAPISTGFRLPGNHKCLARIAMMLFKISGRRAEV